MTKIDFEIDTKYGVYRSAIIVFDGQPMPTDEEVEQEKQRRLVNWLEVHEQPSEEVVEENHGK